MDVRMTTDQHCKAMTCRSGDLPSRLSANKGTHLLDSRRLNKLNTITTYLLQVNPNIVRLCGNEQIQNDGKFVVQLMQTKPSGKMSSSTGDG